MMAATYGGVPAGITHRQLCGFHFNRHRVKRERRKELALAIAEAIGGGESE